jgi:CheY-like chemotaxis protein
MDSNMPVMDGKSPTKSIRGWKGAEEVSPTQKHAADLPIIAFTANVIDENGFNEEFPGMTDYLFKPLKMQKLQDLLEKYCPRGK